MTVGVEEAPLVQSTNDPDTHARSALRLSAGRGATDRGTILPKMTALDPLLSVALSPEAEMRLLERSAIVHAEFGYRQFFVEAFM